MAGHVYKTIELTGTSSDSIESAVNGALERAADTTRGLRWIEVTEIRGNVVGNRVDHWQVSMKVGFSVE